MFDFRSTSEIAVTRSLTNLRRSSFGTGLAGDSTAIIRLRPIAAANCAFSGSSLRRVLKRRLVRRQELQRQVRHRRLEVHLLEDRARRVDALGLGGVEVDVDASVAQLARETDEIRPRHLTGERPVERDIHAVGRRGRPAPPSVSAAARTSRTLEKSSPTEIASHGRLLVAGYSVDDVRPEDIVEQARASRRPRPYCVGRWNPLVFHGGAGPRSTARLVKRDHAWRRSRPPHKSTTSSSSDRGLAAARSPRCSPTWASRCSSWRRGRCSTCRTSRSTCGRTTCRIAARGPRAKRTRAGRRASPTARPTAARSSPASRTRWRRAATSRGSARAFSAAAPTTTAASRCGSPTTTSSRARAMAWASTGRSATRTCRRTTTRRRPSSASSVSVENIRSAPDGIFDKPAPLRAHDTLVQRSCAKLDIRAVPARQAVTTSPRNGRPGCHYCGQCGRGCMTASNYASSYVQIFPAMKTGRVQVVANAMARELITDASGKVTAVSYIDKTDGSEKQVRCRTVVLSASACESSRLLLNSKSSRHPQGLANSSGTVGRYLMDTVGSSMSAAVPGALGHAALQLRRLRLAPLRAVVGMGQPPGARLPARVSHRSRRRLRHARHRLVPRAS